MYLINSFTFFFDFLYRIDCNTILMRYYLTALRKTCIVNVLLCLKRANLVQTGFKCLQMVIPSLFRTSQHEIEFDTFKFLGKFYFALQYQVNHILSHFNKK